MENGKLLTLAKALNEESTEWNNNEFNVLRHGLLMAMLFLRCNACGPVEYNNKSEERIKLDQK